MTDPPVNPAAPRLTFDERAALWRAFCNGRDLPWLPQGPQDEHWTAAVDRMLAALDLVAAARAEAAADRPHVRVQPTMRFGQPHVKGVTTDAIAGRIYAGDPVDMVLDDYPGFTRGDVIVACWFETVHGANKPRRKFWDPWYTANTGLFGRGRYDDIPDPPSRET